jgi:hypothetical protein
MWRTYPVKALVVVKVVKVVVVVVVKVMVQKKRLAWRNPVRAIAMILGPAGRHYRIASILRLAGFGGSGARIEI